MGGFGSGRSGGRPTIDQCAVIDIHQLFLNGYIYPGEKWAGVIAGEMNTMRGIGPIDYQSEVGEDEGRLRLQYKANSDPARVDYWIKLVAVPQPFGGVRWFFLCPRSYLRVLKIYLPLGAIEFASRASYRLAYRSQRQTGQERALTRAFELRQRLGAEGALGSPISKPPRMRRKRFDREIAKVRAVEEKAYRYLAPD